MPTIFSRGPRLLRRRPKGWLYTVRGPVNAQAALVAKAVFDTGTPKGTIHRHGQTARRSIVLSGTEYAYRSSPATTLNTGAWTVALRFKMGEDKTPHERCMFHQGAWIQIDKKSDDTVRVVFWDVSFAGFEPLTTVITITDMNWHTLITDYNGSGSANLYIDGTLVASATGISFAQPSNSNPVHIGHSYDSGNFWNGSLDQVYCWNRVITSAERTEYTNAKAYSSLGTGIKSGLTSAWDLDENPTLKYYQDSSGSNHMQAFSTPSSEANMKGETFYGAAILGAYGMRNPEIVTLTGIQCTTWTESARTGSENDWINEGNAQTSNNAYASSPGTTGGGDNTDSTWLKGTVLTGGSGGIGAGVGNIPDQARILGVVANWERKADNNSATDYAIDEGISLVVDNVITGDDKKDVVTKWPTTDTVKSYGSSTDKWGQTSISGSQVKGNFGMALAVRVFGTGLGGGGIDGGGG